CRPLIAAPAATPRYTLSLHDALPISRRLAAEQLSVPARIMAIADIFEALTAADRPYKAPKTLSESIRIIVRMAREQHIDAELLADRKSTRLNSSHVNTSYAVFCLKKK